MRPLILGLLVARAMTLYEVHQQFARGAGHIYAASYGPIHRALKQLVESGDVKVSREDTGRKRMRYQPTAQGRAAWMAWMRAPDESEDVEVAALARVFLLGQVEDSAVRVLILRNLRERAHAWTVALQSLAAPLGGHDAAVPAFPLATLEYGRASGEALVKWIDGLVEREGARGACESDSDARGAARDAPTSEFAERHTSPTAAEPAR